MAFNSTYFAKNVQLINSGSLHSFIIFYNVLFHEYLRKIVCLK